jgi:hypothetical protein
VVGTALPPSQAPASAAELTFVQKNNLVELLLQCSSMKETSQRDTAVANLRRAVARTIKRSNVAQTDVLNIVSRCLEYDRGLEELLDVVKSQDDGTRGWVELMAYVNTLPKGL